MHSDRAMTFLYIKILKGENVFTSLFTYLSIPSVEIHSPAEPRSTPARSVMAPAHQWNQLTVMQNCMPKCYFECVDVSKLG